MSQIDWDATRPDQIEAFAVREVSVRIFSLSFRFSLPL